VRAHLASCGVLLAAIAACSGRSASNPEFDWFEYTGRDTTSASSLTTGQYRNPILAGFYPDPSVVRVEEDYYLVTSSFAYFPGVPIFHSRDLVHWTQIGHVLDRPSQLNLDSAGVSRGIFAPTIEYHNGTFYVVTTLVDRGGNFLVTATDPRGPWSDPVWLPEVDGIDPSIFFENDSIAWVLNNGPPIGEPLYQGHRAIWIQQFDVRNKRLTGPRSVIVNGGVDLDTKPIWIEGPHLFTKEGWYYLLCAEGGTAEQHSEVVFRAKSPRGPFVPFRGNPILTQRHLPADRPNPITSTGHADLVETPDGWWAVFLGVRPYEGEHYNIGRETFLLPVKWEDGWPVILPKTETVPLVSRAPPLSVNDAPFPTSGSFTLRDEFTDSTLAPYWALLRTPREQWHRVKDGRLTIQARSPDLASVLQPSFIGRRQQHLVADATVSMRYLPAGMGDQSGITAFHDENHHFLLSIARTTQGTVVRLEAKSDTAPARVLAETPVRISGRKPILLRISARGRWYGFAFATSPDEWQTLKSDVDGTTLSTKVAGGFVGTWFGMFARSSSPQPLPPS